MSRFAEQTTVSSEASRAEIERILRRYGAGKFMSGWDDDHAYIAFEMHARRIRFILPLPDPESSEFKLTPGGKRERDRAGQMKAWEQGCRSRWRALALVIKAKLEAVESGITCFEDEFLAHIVLPDNTTVGDNVRPRIVEAYQSGKMLPLLPAPKGKTHG